MYITFGIWQFSVVFHLRHELLVHALHQLCFAQLVLSHSQVLFAFVYGGCLLRLTSLQGLLHTGPNSKQLDKHLAQLVHVSMVTH